MARDSNGGLNYNVLLAVAQGYGLRDIGDLLYLAGQIDVEIHKAKRK